VVQAPVLWTDDTWVTVRGGKQLGSSEGRFVRLPWASVRTHNERVRVPETIFDFTLITHPGPKPMSVKTKPKVAPTAPAGSAPKRPGAMQGASSKTVEFHRLLGQLRRYLNWISENPQKDAEAVGKILLEVKIAKRRPSASKVTVKSKSTLGKGKIMVKDDRQPKSNTAVNADRPSTSPNLAVLLATVLDQPEKWMATPNHQFGGRRPNELVGTAEEKRIFDLLHAVDQGLF